MKRTTIYSESRFKFVLFFRYLIKMKVTPLKEELKSVKKGHPTHETKSTISSDENVRVPEEFDYLEPLESKESSDDQGKLRKQLPE